MNAILNCLFRRYPTQMPTHVTAFLEAADRVEAAGKKAAESSTREPFDVFIDDVKERKPGRARRRKGH